MKVFFDSHKQIIFQTLERSTESVKIAVAWINSKEYFEIFNSLLDRNIPLQIICTDNIQNRSHQKVIDALIKKGANIKLLKMPRATNHMHHKFCIVDSNLLINGSFNWSTNATKSFENLIVVENDPEAVTSFLNEFDRLNKINPETIKKLQKAKKCKNKNCYGELFNILVFTERTNKYFESFGDIVEVCNSCLDFRLIEAGISDSQLYLLLEDYAKSNDIYSKKEINRSIDAFLNNYINNEITVHAIGRINVELSPQDIEYISTEIIWKSTFVGDKLQEEYETDFDVY